MRVEETTVYQFDELNEKAKEHARDWYRQGALDYDWWDYIYDDAETIGLTITDFDLDRNRHATGKLTKSIKEACQLIHANHGKACDTYQVATEYLGTITHVDQAESNDEEDHDDEREEVREHFEQALLEEYSIMLQHEYEYLMSNESVDETIRCNEYEFTEAGKRF